MGRTGAPGAGFAVGAAEVASADVEDEEEAPTSTEV